MTVLPSSDHPISTIGVCLDQGTLSTYRRQGIYRNVSMNGEPGKAGKFLYTLHCSLWSEHLGLHAREITQISDPVADATYRDLWLATAQQNTIIYQDVFDCIPNELIHSRAALRQSTNQRKEKLWHNTIDLGIASEKLETYENGETKVTDNGEVEVYKRTSCLLPFRIHVSQRFKTGV